MVASLQPWQILNSKVIHQTPWIEVVEELRTQAFIMAEIDEMIARGKICDNWTLAGLLVLS